MLRRALILFGILALLGGPAVAQDEQRATQFLQGLNAVMNSEDLGPAADYIAAHPDDAYATAVFLAQKIENMAPEQQKNALFILNLLARALDVRNGDKRLTQELESEGVLIPEEMWQTTALARGAPTTSNAGPGPSKPSGVSDDVVLVILLLRLGDYPDALRLATAIGPDHPEQTVTLARYTFHAMAGIGAPNVVLDNIDDLLALAPSGAGRLPFELLATYVSVKSSAPTKTRQHLKEATALASKAPGAYGQIARFLTKSWAFQLELQANPRMPFSQIKQRHDDAFAELRSISPENRQELTTELYWVGEAFWETWVEHILVDILKYNTEAAEQYSKMMEGDLTLYSQMAQELGTGDYEGTLSYVILLLRVVGLLQETGPDELAQAHQLLVQTNQQLPAVQTLVDQLYDEINKRFSGLLQSKNLTLNPRSSAFSLISGGVHLLNALQLLAEYEDKTFSASDSATTKKELDLAREASQQVVSVFLLQEVTDAQLDYLEKTRPPGWEQASEEMINTFLNDSAMQGLRSLQAKFYYRRGELREQQNRKAEAIADYQKAIDVFEAFIREIGGGSESASFIRLWGNDLYEAMARLQLEQGKNSDAFNTIGRMQQAETAGVFQMNDLRNQVKPEDQSLITRAQQGKEEIEAQEKSLANLKAARAPAAQISHASQVLAQSRDSYYQAVTDLEKKYPAFNRLDIKPINFSKLQRAIPPNTLVVLLFPTDDQLYLMEATNTSLVVRQVAIKRSELEDLAKDFRGQIVRYSRNPSPTFSWSSPEGTELKQNLTTLYDTVVKPIEPEMKDKEAVAFVPYGNLVYLPFQAFMTVKADGSPEFLVEKKQVVVLSKAADLDQIYGPPSANTGSLVAFGNPDGSLAGATQEVKALADIFPGSKVYLEGQATEDKLAGIQAPQVSYLHLATHGNLNPQDPRQSYLTMARGEKLSVSEITGYHLDSAGGDLSLVTLSACQTALADRGGAADGSDLRSLADAFSFAGCRSMVASLWKVEDNATRDLMVGFYKNLKSGKSKAAALQAAQVSLLKQDKYTHPFYWAPFILIGDWR